MTSWKSTNQSLTNFAPLQSPVIGVESRKQMVFNWWVVGLKLVPQMKHFDWCELGPPWQAIPQQLEGNLKGVSCLMHFYNPTHHCDYCS